MGKNLYDAIIIGAGIAGSSLAQALARLGWDILLVDCHNFPRHKVCGEFLSPESKMSLDSLGLSEITMSLSPAKMETCQLVLASGKKLEVPLPGTAFGVSRYLLDHTLHTYAGSMGAQVKTGAKAVSIQQALRRFTVEIERLGKSEFIEARTVVAAWGRNSLSSLRNTASTPNTRSSYIGIKSHFQGIQSNSAVELYFFPGGYLGVSPIEYSGTNVCALVTREAFEKTNKSVLGVIEAAAKWNPELGKRLAGGIPVPKSQTAVSPVDTKRHPLLWDRFPLIGDAATMIPPLCGDGMTMALRAAEICVPLANRFLQGKISETEWKVAFSSTFLREYSLPLRLGRVIQACMLQPALSNALVSLGHLSPNFASRMIRATRGKS